MSLKLIKYIETVLLPFFGGLGVLGNLASIKLIMKSRARSTFHHSLISLAVIDTVFIILMIMQYSTDLTSSNATYCLLNPLLFHPLVTIMLTSETFLIISIAFERFLAVGRPIQYHQGTLRRSRKVHTLVFIIVPLLFAVFFNVTKFFELEPGECLAIKPMRKHPAYSFFYIFLNRTIITGFVPTIFLCFINFALYRKVAGCQVSINKNNSSLTYIYLAIQR